MENDILSKVSNVRRRVIETVVEWGLYVYKKADGKYFTDGEGNVLNIPSMTDYGAWADAQKTVDTYGQEALEVD